MLTPREKLFLIKTAAARCVSSLYFLEAHLTQDRKWVKDRLTNLNFDKLAFQIGSYWAWKSTWPQHLFLGSSRSNCNKVLLWSLLAHRIGKEHARSILRIFILFCSRPTTAPPAPQRGGGAFSLGRGAAFTPARWDCVGCTSTVEYEMRHWSAMAVT